MLCEYSRIPGLFDIRISSKNRCKCQTRTKVTVTETEIRGGEGAAEGRKVVGIKGVRMVRADRLRSPLWSSVDLSTGPFGRPRFDVHHVGAALHAFRVGG